MTSIVSRNPLVRKIADGGASDELLDMLMHKQLPFTEEEYLESLIFVLKLEKYKVKAVGLIKVIPETVKADYIERPAANHRVSYFVLLEALNRQNLTIISKAVRNQSLPYEFLIKIAEKGNGTILEILLDNQVKLIAYPEILDAMENNPEAGNYIKGKIKEIKDYYLDPAQAEEIPEEEVIDDVKEALVQEQKKEKEGEDDEELLDEEMEVEALNVLQQINQMSISERIKLALTGTRTQRMILIKDPNKMVSLAVLECPKISIDEISLLANNKSLPTEILTKIALNREWTKNYTVILELALNPKTPLKFALGFIKKLYSKDLNLLIKNKNVSPVVRKLALEFFSKKSGR